MIKLSVEFLEKNAARLILSLIACIAAHLLWVSFHLQIDYHDSYFVLLNARCIATGNPLGYTEWRPAILPIMLSPMLLLERWISDANLIFGLCHTAMIIIYILTLLSFYHFLRLQFRPIVSILTLALFAFNPLLIHSAPYCKEDVVGLLLLICSFLFYFRSANRNSSLNLAVSVFTIALAIGVRFNFFVVPIIIGLHLITNHLVDSRLQTSKFLISIPLKAREILIYAVLPVIIFVLIISIHYWRLKLAPFQNAFSSYLHNSMFKMADLVKAQGALPATVNLEFLIKICGWIVPAIALLGVVVKIRNLNSFLWLNLLWLANFLILQTFIVQYKEVRFLIPLLPPILIFFAEGLLWLAHKQRWFLVLAGLAVFELAPKTHAEINAFRDPIYSKPFAKPISDYAANLAGDRTVFWVGHFYSIHPKNYYFDNRDVTYYIYHLYVNALAFYSKKYRMENLRNPRYLPPEAPGMPVFIGPNAGAIAEDGDTLVINLEDDAYTTSNMPKTLKPLIVQRARKSRFYPTESDQTLFSSSNMSDAVVEVEQLKGALRIAGTGIPNGRYEVYIKLKGVEMPVGLQVFDIKDGSFVFTNSDVSSPLNIEEVFLFYFDSVKEFELPY